MPNVTAPKNANYRGWFRDLVNDRLSVFLGVSEYLRFEVGNHTRLNSITDTKNVRINSRNYTQASGDASGVQIKPNQTVAGAGITGLEVSPRFASTIGGTSLVGIKCDPVLKGSGTGTLSGSVTGIQVNIDFGISQTRTIDLDVSAFESFLAVPSNMTYTGDVSFLRVRTVNIRGWDFFLNADDANVGLLTVSDDSMNKNPEGDTESGSLKIRIGSTAYEIPIYVAA